jgi:YVTN family beta-propeller protein
MIPMLTKLTKVAAVTMFAISVGGAANAQTVQSVIPLSGVPEGIAVNYLTDTVYVAIPGTGSHDSVAIINGKTGKVDGSIKIPPIGQNIAVDSVRNLIYVGGSYTDNDGRQHNDMAVINGKTKKVEGVVQLSDVPGDGIQGVAANSINDDVYVIDASANTVDVLRAGSLKVGSVIGVAEGPYGVTLNPYTNTVYVALSNGTVSVIDGWNKTILATTTVGGTNTGIAANWGGGNVFVVDNAFGDSTVGVLDSNGNVLANIPVGDTPFGVDVDPVKNLAYVTNTQDGTVSVIDGSTNTVTETLPVTGLYVAVNPVTAVVYVGGQDASITTITEN